MLHRNTSTARRALAALAVGLALGLAILTAGALPVLAQGPVPAVGADPGDDGPDIPGMADREPTGDDAADVEPGFPGRLARRLDLTGAQQDAIAKIFAAGRDRSQALRKQVLRLEHDLQGEMMKDDPAEKTVLGLAKQIGDVRTQLQAGRLQDRLAMRRLLTPEQRDKLLLSGGPRGGFGPGFGPGGPHRSFWRGGPGRGWRGGNLFGNGPGAGRGPGGDRPAPEPRPGHRTD